MLFVFRLRLRHVISALIYQTEDDSHGLLSEFWDNFKNFDRPPLRSNVGYFTVNTGDADKKGHITWELNLWRTVDVQADAGMAIARPIFQHCDTCRLPEPSTIDEGWLCWIFGVFNIYW